MIKKIIETELLKEPDIDKSLNTKLHFEDFNIEQRPFYYTCKIEHFTRALNEILEQQAFIRGYRPLRILEMITGEYDPRVQLLRRLKKGWEGQPEKFDKAMFESLIKLKNMVEDPSESYTYGIDML